MHTDWLIVANASNARIFLIQKEIGKPRQLILLQNIEHPASRLHNRELATDKAGVYRTNKVTGGGHSQDYDPKSIEMNKFAKEVAQIIDHARTLNRFNRLFITSSPHFYGLLEKNMTGSIKDLIKKVVLKDYTCVIPRDLQRLLFSNNVKVPS